MDWTVYNFEFPSSEARERFMDEFEADHPVEFPEDDLAVHEHVLDDEGDRHGAEYAWIDGEPYLYVTALAPVDGLLSSTADDWDRAVVADFDSTTETCREATVYESVDGRPSEVVTYQGVAELGGADVVWRCLVDHDFRFRAYCEGPPTTITFAPIMSAFQFVPEENTEEFVSEMEAETGVERTPEAMASLRDDPAKEL